MERVIHQTSTVVCRKLFVENKVNDVYQPTQTPSWFSSYGYLCYYYLYYRDQTEVIYRGKCCYSERPDRINGSKHGTMYS